ncbi:Spermidine/putrescine import ATP-binding protein PotA [Tsuneonella dongtanensis]|uniref:Spermidine/putrescine import ATP-binding protein PotA n=2 Tax=Tsuneonella dongtanensis TaxID=692370 RepID=A0A1B2A991_9SPHN|nr:Spermidine/putrescine import ATP-binding protein PotA [Tsuneonella dongtanensis]
MMLAGFERPTSGRILLEGRDVADQPAHKRDIGVVFQNYALFPHMTAAQNIAFPLKVRRLSRAEVEARVEYALTMVRLDQMGSSRPGQMSGGQQQRIALARALVFNPSLIVMDEPLGALDKNLREEMQYEIKALHRQLGVTIVYVTHDQSEALTMSDRIAVFQKGRIIQLDSPRTIYDRPGNLFVACFLGENNQLAGKVVEKSSVGLGKVKLASGDIVRCQFPQAHNPGADVVLLVRPEDVLIGDLAVACDYRTTGTVREMIYHGQHFQVSIELADGEAIVALCRPGASASLAAGTAIAIGWQADHAVALVREP